MAVHKGTISRPTVIRGIRNPEFQVNLQPVRGAYFDLYAPRDQRRTIRVRADIAIRSSNQRGIACDQQMIVINRLEQGSRTGLVIAQAFQQSSIAAVRVTHPLRLSLDIALRISGSRTLTADSIQHLEQIIHRSADARLTVFNVIINEQHEIQP